MSPTPLANERSPQPQLRLAERQWPRHPGGTCRTDADRAKALSTRKAPHTGGIWRYHRPMAMTLRLNDADDRLLTERARSENRSKQEVAREAIHAYLTDQVRRIEDLEDELALARYQLRKQLGEVTYVSQAEARSALRLPSTAPRTTSA
jgi:predicted transcriptional regulator